MWCFNFSSTEILVFSLILDQIGLQTKDSEFLPNSAIETQKTQKLGVFAEILPPVEALIENVVDIESQYIKIQNVVLKRSCEVLML